MKDPISLSELFEEANSLYYGIDKNIDVKKAFEVFEEIILIGKSESGEAIFPDNFSNLIFEKYDDGAKENKDYELASKLYDLAAKTGSIDALNNIGHLFLNGQGVIQDFNKAEEYWMAASNKGNTKSQMNLVNLYKSNRYEMLNYSKAIFYCNLAAKNGDQSAIKLLPILNRRANNTTKTSKGKNKSFWSKLRNKMKG